jgi:hypothetical protein
MAKNKHGTVGAPKSTKWYLKGTKTEVVRVIVPKGYGQNHWATREGNTYTVVELRDCEKR